MMEFLAANWYWIGPVAAVFLAPLLKKLGITVPVINPKPDGPAPAFPTTFGHGELMKYIVDVINKGLQDGTIKLPFPLLAQPNAVQLTPDQVMQLLNAKPPQVPSDFPQP